MTDTGLRRPATYPNWFAMRPVRWYRPLLGLAAAMAVLTVVALIGLAVDPRQVTGLPLWAKPLKFAISTALYAVTFSWLIGQLERFRRLGAIAGAITTVGLAIELLLITGVAITGQTSHFNISDGLHATIWYSMAGAIAAVWIMTLLVAVALFRTPLGDSARTLAIRGGTVIAIVGMALAMLMTVGDEEGYARGIAGAHTVGLADGGPGLPILGWSTVAGDLRIPHFVGMHALQLLPLLAIVLELLARRSPRFADPRVRFRLVAVATATYSAAVVIVTWQALIGQSIVHPSGPVLAAGIGVTLLAAAAVLAVLAPSARREAPAEQPARLPE